MDQLTVALDAMIHDLRPHWLSKLPWRWEIRSATGTLMADGEGCASAGVAIETARVCAYEEGWLQDVR